MLDPEDRSGTWSLGTAFIWERSPYAEQGVLPDFIPTLTYAGERFFIDSTDIGWHVADDAKWQFDLFGSYRLDGYNDFSGDSTGGAPRPPDDPLAGLERKNAFEAGAQLTRKTSLGRFSAELRRDVSDVHDGEALRLRWAKVFRTPAWQIEPWAEWGHWSADRADYYFGLNKGELGEGTPEVRIGSLSRWSVGTAVRYSFARQHELSMNLAYRIFDDAIDNSPIVEETATPSVQIAYRYQFDDLRRPADDGDYNFYRNNGNPWSLRVAGGCTSTTKLNEILRGNFNCNYEDVGMASVSAARLASERALGLPLEAWVRLGVARHFQGDVGPDFFEGFFSVKALYRRFPWSKYVGTRIGIGSHVSYAGEIPALELEKAEDNARNTSRFLHHLEVSLDVSVGDVFRVPSWRNLYFGYAAHHRSGIFSSADIYSNVYGGSNINSLYLEWEFR
jgi:outer membrane protein